MKDIKSDIQHAINKEHSILNVSSNDIKIANEIKGTIESLEIDYERLHDKIVVAIYQRVEKIGKEQASNDEVVQILKSILNSEKEKEESI